MQPTVSSRKQEWEEEISFKSETLEYISFKYKDLRIGMLLPDKGKYLFSFNLKTGYHHVEIAELCHKHLRFACDNKFCVFTVLLFGVASACYIFTKLGYKGLCTWTKVFVLLRITQLQ